MLLLLTLIFGKGLLAKSTQNCIWVPKGYFPSCPYRNHHINQVREFSRLALVRVSKHHRVYNFIVRKIDSLCDS